MISKRTFITPTAVRQGSSHSCSFPEFQSRQYLPLRSSGHDPGSCFYSAIIEQRLTPLPADLVQDLYLKELKAYKAPAIKAGDADAHVQKFAPPKAPQSPEETDIANELKAYEAQAVEVEGQAEAGSLVEKEMDWFEEEPEEETAHH
jgi:F-type H+-transporting ATPase subunit h